MWHEASAPSNIALIKYMGKIDSVANRPTNISFSYTLNDLRSFVRIKLSSQLENDTWAAYARNDLLPIELSLKGQNKFLKHFQSLKERFELSGYYEIESANNFPSDCGLASSASSFAALTLAAYETARHLNGLKLSTTELAEMSRRGSGSSCRSFFSPWSVWSPEGVSQIDLPITQLKHMVILCDENIKSVSSSEAHIRVLTSDLFEGRISRAENRYHKLIQNLNEQNWTKSFEIVWNEFWDMHALFHTSSPPFMYLNGSAQSALNDILKIWTQEQDGPLVTMDAGSNIHLLFRADQEQLYSEYENKFGGSFNLWTTSGYKKNEH